MFTNKMLANGNPVCPGSNTEIVPDQGKTSGAVFAPGNRVALMHNTCIEAHNAAVQLRTDLGL